MTTAPLLLIVSTTVAATAGVLPTRSRSVEFVGSTVCLSGDSLSSWGLQALKQVVTDTMKRRITGLPNVSPSSVTVLTDSATCARVLSAYNAARGESVTQLYVWQVGSYYDATDTAGVKPNRIDRLGHLVLDSTLTKVNLYLD